MNHINSIDVKFKKKKTGHSGTIFRGIPPGQWTFWIDSVSIQQVKSPGDLADYFWFWGQIHVESAQRVKRLREERRMERTGPIPSAISEQSGSISETIVFDLCMGTQRPPCILRPQLSIPNKVLDAECVCVCVCKRACVCVWLISRPRSSLRRLLNCVAFQFLTVHKLSLSLSLSLKAKAYSLFLFLCLCLHSSFFFLLHFGFICRFGCCQFRFRIAKMAFRLINRIQSLFHLFCWVFFFFFESFVVAPVRFESGTGAKRSSRRDLRAVCTI